MRKSEDFISILKAQMSSAKEQGLILFHSGLPKHNVEAWTLNEKSEDLSSRFLSARNANANLESDTSTFGASNSSFVC